MGYAGSWFCPLDFAASTMLIHEKLAAGPHGPRELILRGGFAGSFKNPPCLHPYLPASNADTRATATVPCSPSPEATCCLEERRGLPEVSRQVPSRREERNGTETNRWRVAAGLAAGGGS